MKCPCVVECPDRTAECKIKCEKWKKYEAEYLEEYRHTEDLIKLNGEYWAYMQDSFVRRQR